jgi:predicted nucleic acid-binding Zn ribbon protein
MGDGVDRSGAEGGSPERPREGSLGSIVNGVLKKLGGRGRFTEEEMAAAWREACGEEAARHSRCVSFRRSSVFVNVDTSSWLYELTTRKREILKVLEASLKGKKFRDIRFRIGDIKDRPGRDGRKTEEEPKR